MPTLLQLHYFRVLAENGHLTRTAESLLVSQTALSNMISRLESELGVKLFDLIGRNICLNEYGKAYLKHVKKVFEELENGRIELENMSENINRHISVAMRSSYLWADMIGKFKQKYPKYIISQQEDNLENLKELLKSHKLDFIIAGKDDIPSSQGLASTLIRRERIVLSVLPSHRFAGRSSVLLKELAEEPFISLPRDEPFRRFCDNLCRQAGFEPNTTIECDYMMRSRFLSYGYGVCLTTQTSADIKFLGPVCYIPLADDFAIRSTCLYWVRNRPLSKAAEDFRKYIAEYFNSTVSLSESARSCPDILDKVAPEGGKTAVADLFADNGK